LAKKSIKQQKEEFLAAVNAVRRTPGDDNIRKAAKAYKDLDPVLKKQLADEKVPVEKFTKKSWSRNFSK
jgi:hypothetical protein